MEELTTTNLNSVHHHGVQHHHEVHPHHGAHHHKVHYSQRAGRNRHTSSQKKRALYGKILFTVLSLIATFIVAIILYDRFIGLF